MRTAAASLIPPDPTGRWRNVDNQDFYDHADPARLADDAGLADGVDLDVAQRFFSDREAQVLEVGAGSGRIVRMLLAQGFSRVHAVERSAWAESVRAEHDAAIADGRLTLHAQDLMALDVPERFTTILWLFSGITDFARTEQLAALTVLSRHLRPGGRLIIDLPDTQAAHEAPRRIEGLWRDGYVPSPREMSEYKIRLGFSAGTVVQYLTRTDEARMLYVLRSPGAHSQPPIVAK